MLTSSEDGYNDMCHDALTRFEVKVLQRLLYSMSSPSRLEARTYSTLAACESIPRPFCHKIRIHRIAYVPQHFFRPEGTRKLLNEIKPLNDRSGKKINHPQNKSSFYTPLLKTTIQFRDTRSVYGREIYYLQPLGYIQLAFKTEVPH